MTEIKLRADEARNEAIHVQGEADAAKEQIDRLRGRLNNLIESFTGQTQLAFDEEFNQWKTSADQMLDNLRDLGQFLTNAANTIEQTDADIASSLRGG